MVGVLDVRYATDGADALATDRWLASEATISGRADAQLVAVAHALRVELPVRVSPFGDRDSVRRRTGVQRR